jgi:hypothetical protein
MRNGRGYPFEVNLLVVRLVRPITIIKHFLVFAFLICFLQVGGFLKQDKPAGVNPFAADDGAIAGEIEPIDVPPKDYPCMTTLEKINELAVVLKVEPLDAGKATFTDCLLKINELVDAVNAK